VPGDVGGRARAAGGGAGRRRRGNRALARGPLPDLATGTRAVRIVPARRAGRGDGGRTHALRAVVVVAAPHGSGAPGGLRAVAAREQVAGGPGARRAPLPRAVRRPGVRRQRRRARTPRSSEPDPACRRRLLAARLWHGILRVAGSLLVSLDPGAQRSPARRCLAVAAGCELRRVRRPRGVGLGARHLEGGWGRRRWGRNPYDRRGPRVPDRRGGPGGAQ